MQLQFALQLHLFWTRVWLAGTILQAGEGLQDSQAGCSVPASHTVVHKNAAATQTGAAAWCDAAIPDQWLQHHACTKSSLLTISAVAAACINTKSQLG